MTATSSATAWFTAVPMAPEELSTCSSAGDTRSRNSTAASAPRTGSCRATVLISLTACRTRWIAGCDFQPKAPRRNWRVNPQRAALALDILTRALAPQLPPPRLLVFVHAGPFFDRHDDIRTALAEALEVQALDELREGRLPGFLLVVVELAELLRVQAELARHLHVGVGEAMPPARVDPDLKPLGHPPPGHESPGFYVESRRPGILLAPCATCRRETSEQPGGHQPTGRCRSGGLAPSRRPGVGCSTRLGPSIGATAPVSAEKEARLHWTAPGRRRSAGARAASRNALREEATEVPARTRGRRNDQRDDRAEERALLELLSHGLSDEEIQRVLARALLVLRSEERRVGKE